MEPPAKRHKNDEYQAAYSQPSDEASRVLHVTGLGPNVTEADLLEAFSVFGAINYASVKRFRYVLGLIEFEEMESAVLCVTTSLSNAIFVTGTESVVTFSSLMEVPRCGFETAKPNHVLVITVYNVTYTINAMTLKEICSPHGEVFRIAIVRKTHNIVALVEFRSADVAKVVKQNINGADIYSGCCTLKVEYAHVDRVRLTVVDEDHMDFTVPMERNYDGGSGAPVYPSLGAAEPYSAANNYSGDNFGRAFHPLPPHNAPREVYANRCAEESPSRKPATSSDKASEGPAFSRGPVSPPQARCSHVADSQSNSRTLLGYGYGYTADEMFGRRQDWYDSGYPTRTPGLPVSVNACAYKNDVFRGDIDGSMMTGGQGCVVIVYGVDQQSMNCDKLFNVFCQYGNVLRILFMKNKSTTAIFEMGNQAQARNLIKYLNGMELFGAKLEFKLSFQSSVKSVREPCPLGDGTPSYRDYTQSRNQRFLNFTTAERNRMCIPQTVLYWFNAPPEMDGRKITEMFQRSGAPMPVNTHVFHSRTGRSSTGTTEFATVRAATDALALSNHSPVICDGSKYPFIVKFAFTASRAPGARNDDGENRSRGSNFVAHFSREDKHFDKEFFRDTNDDNY